MENCTIADCSRPKRTRAADYCEMHYYRVRRTGETGGSESKRRIRGTCRHVECERPDAGRHGWCTLHADRIRKHGDPDCVLKATPTPQESHPQWKGNDVTYSGMHMRIRAVRGPASEYACADCGGGASHWSYDHRDAQERQSSEGAYSTDLNHYEPRCVPCHKSYDLAMA